MTDLVERLRKNMNEQPLLREAADEIERLRAMQARWTATDHHNMTQAKEKVDAPRS